MPHASMKPVARAPTNASFAQRLCVLALFVFAPMLPGYRGIRIPLYTLAVALFAG
jgi:hypothetical protein